MNKTGWIIFTTAVVVLLGGLIVWTRINNPPIDVSNVNTASVLAATEESGNIADRTKGSAANEIVLVEYGDYQCPSCASAYPHVNTLMEECDESVTFVFRNFPLTSIHPNAKAAAAAAEAAGLQGKFWEMHGLLYENLNDWSTLDANQRTNIFNQYADTLELDADQFKADFAGAEVAQKIRFDQELAKKDGVSATPTFFLNGERLDDATSTSLVRGDLTAIKEKLDALIEE